MIKVARSQIHGRGVFATRTIQRGSVVDRGFVVPFGEEDGGQGGLIDRYAFEYDATRRCLVLGVASLCNHTEEPNVEIEINDQTGTYRLMATKPIRRGEELLIDYGSEYWEQPGLTRGG
jgi:hypothetical protein